MTRDELVELVYHALRELAELAERVRPTRVPPPDPPFTFGPLYWPYVGRAVGCDAYTCWETAGVQKGGRFPLYYDIERVAAFIIERCGCRPHEVLKALRGIEAAANWCREVLGEKPTGLLAPEVWAALEMEGALSALSEI